MIEYQKYVHHGVELEAAILGACLLEKDAFGRTYGLLDEKCFYLENHQKVYKALREMFDSNVPIDIYTASEWLTRTKVQLVGYDTLEWFLCRLTNQVCSSAHIEYHSHIVKEMWRRREILRLKFSPLNDDIDSDGNLSDIQEKITALLSTPFESEWFDMTELMFNLLKHQVDVMMGRKEFLSTGFKKLDTLNGGFHPGQMIVVGARPSVGKSALMGQMAIEMAKKGKKVGIISLEMDNNEISARLASLQTDIDFWRIFRTIAHDEELHKRFYEQVQTKLINLPIYLSNKTKVNINEIRAKAIKLQKTKGCDCLMIDYLQLIDTDHGKNTVREQEVAKISRGIKLMAFELNIPVIILCQLNRQVTARSYKDRFPKLSDLRESGSIEQDADIVMFLHRDWMSGWQTDDQNDSTEFKADLIIPKWRNGAPCHLELDFEPTKMRFKERTDLPNMTGVGDSWKPYSEKEDET